MVAPQNISGPFQEQLVSSVLEVSLGAICHNYSTLQKKIGGRLCAPVVKADAYGLGLGPVAKALWGEGARHFFVGTLGEGVALRSLVPFATIYILNGLLEGAEEVMARNNLIPVLANKNQVLWWQRHALHIQRELPAVLQVETGLIRLGLSLKDLEFLSQDPTRLSGVGVHYLMTHLACAYAPCHPFNKEQENLFQKARQFFPHVPISLAGSGGLFRDIEMGHMVRPGRLLYGSTFTGGYDFSACIRPVVCLKARILHTQHVDAGTAIGYNHTYHASHPLLVGTLGIGYGDGYMRSLGNRSYGWVGAYRVPVIGSISMDLTTVDLSRVPLDVWQKNPWVELINHRLTVDQVASLGGTVSWEVLTGLGNRVFKRYVE